MNERELRTKARIMNADVLANAIQVEATILRRWINGGINSNVEAAVRRNFEEA